MIYDWKENKEAALENGIRETRRDVLMESEDGIVMGCTFRNFPNLKFEEGLRIKDCVFEDCGDITFDDENIVYGCTFRRVDTVYVVRGKIKNSCFSELKSKCELIISMDDSEISRCSFDDVELYDDAYLCDGSGCCCTIEHCEFSNIRTSRRDRKIINGWEATGGLFSRLESCNIVDEKTCTGLEKVECIN